MQREAGFTDPVGFGVNGEVVGGAKVGSFEDGTPEYGPVEVTVEEDGVGQISLHKIYLFEPAVRKADILELQSVKGRKVKQAAFEPEGNDKAIAVIEVQPQQLTALKEYIFEYSTSQFGHTHITILKDTFYKVVAGQVGVGEGTGGKRTVFVFTFG